MIAGVNKVFLIGFVGEEAELKEARAGEKSARFTVRTAEQWRSKDTGEERTREDTHKCIAWRGAFHRAAELRPGDLVQVEGKLHYHNGETEVLAHHIMVVEQAE